MNDSFPLFSVSQKSKIKPAENAGRWPLLKKRKIQAAIDIGSNKITCLIGRASLQEKDTVEILGCGWVKSEGIVSGDMVNVPMARKAISAAYQDAVLEAGYTPKRKELAVNLSCGDPYSNYVSASLTLGGEEATSREIKLLLEAAKKKCSQHKDRLVRLFPISYVIDGHAEIETPIGQPCYSLDSKYLAVLASEQPCRTLGKNLDQINLYASPYLPAAFASGIAALQPQERDYGTLVIDLGAGTTSWALFLKNKPHGIGQVKWGGNYITRFLMSELGINFEAAEKLKARYGCPRFGLEDETEISLPENSNRPHNRINRSEISTIIALHIRKILSLVYQDISALPGVLKKNAPPVWKRVVLTGGGSLLEGIDNEVSAIFNAPCRLGGPDNAKGIPSKMLGFAPSLSCAVGLLTWRIGADRSFGHIGLQGIQRDEGFMERIIRFIQNTE